MRYTERRRLRRRRRAVTPTKKRTIKQKSALSLRKRAGPRIRSKVRPGTIHIKAKAQTDRGRIDFLISSSGSPIIQKFLMSFHSPFVFLPPFRNGILSCCGSRWRRSFFLTLSYPRNNTHFFVFQGIVRIRARERRQIRRVEEECSPRGQGWPASERRREQETTQVEEDGCWQDAFK